MTAEKERAPRDVLTEFFAAHRPLPYSTGYPEKASSWYACTCKKWASDKTISPAEYHHIVAFEKHMADVLVADGWLRNSPATKTEEAGR